MKTTLDHDRYQGFSLKSICWGYQDIFRKRIDALFEEKLIGPERPNVTRIFFNFMKESSEDCFDYILHEFLKSIHPGTRWIFDLPGLFSEITSVGALLGKEKRYHGALFFQTLSEGGFGNTPPRVRLALEQISLLFKEDSDLAAALIRGYRTLVDRLQPEEIRLYVREGLRMAASGRESARRFLRCDSPASESIIRSLTRECRMEDVQTPMARLLKALTGRPMEVSHLGDLDSDDLIERGSSVVCLYQWLYVPIAFRHFDNARLNRRWYLLLAVTASGMLAEKSFPLVHGHPAYGSIDDVAGTEPVALNLLQCLEIIRVGRRMRDRWPGARRLIDWGFQTHFNTRPPQTPEEEIIRLGMTENARLEPAALEDILEHSENVFDTAHRIADIDRAELLNHWPEFGRRDLHPLTFIPDFMFPGSVSRPPSDRLVADLKSRARAKPRRPDEEPEAELRKSADASGAHMPREGEPVESTADAAFLYDEWFEQEQTYRPNFCRVHEQPVKADGGDIPEALDTDIRRIRRIFEQIKPESASREKYLDEGDHINTDLLTDYLVSRRRDPAPRIRFYEKPLIRRRDIGTLILLDVSGSTGGQEDGEKTIDIEKKAALIIGEGLHSIGDDFAVCGFSSNGPEDCVYTVYKDFEQDWDMASKRRIHAARPGHSTRMGAALRHAGWKLGEQPHRQRLILLITDGKPMDKEYDPHTRYAQYDVRKACEENARKDIFTFAVTTEANSRADMEIMFPRNRFTILRRIADLPRVLPRLYMHLTF